MAVRLNNLWNPRLAPRAGEHVFSGGIYRDVYFMVTNPVYVDWYGTYVTTPLATPEKAIVNIQTDVRNDGDEAKSIKLRTDILDPQGHLVLSVATIKSLNGEECILRSYHPLKLKERDVESKEVLPNVYEIVFDTKKGETYKLLPLNCDGLPEQTSQ